MYETAAMLLLARYSGGTDALCAIVREGKRCPVYCDFEKEGSLIGCCSAVKAQADGAVQHGAAGFDTVCAELGLSPMPVLTDDEDFFNAFSLNGAGPQTALCLFFDVRTGAVCARYNAAHYGEDMAGRLLDSLAVVLQGIVRGEDSTGAIGILSDAQRAELDAFNETDASYDAGETLIDRIDRAAERFPDAINRYLTENRITHIFMTTQVGRQYAELFSDGEYPRYLSVGGETLVPVQPPCYSFNNAYGPTECTVFTTVFPVDRLYRNVPIGKALPEATG